MYSRSEYAVSMPSVCHADRLSGLTVYEPSLYGVICEVDTESCVGKSCHSSVFSGLPIRFLCFFAVSCPVNRSDTSYSYKPCNGRVNKRLSSTSSEYK